MEKAGGTRVHPSLPHLLPSCRQFLPVWEQEGGSVEEDEGRWAQGSWLRGGSRAEEEVL